jgi:methylated-DNA-[protein]-cysteine S-methyltransferase
METRYFTKEIQSPVGTLKLLASEAGLAAVLWENDKPNRVRLNPQVPDNGNPFIAAAEKQIAEYFSGRRKSFDVKLDFKGTAFQKQVWQALLEIPYGETRSYAEIARRIHRPKAVRAVGAANGKNPLSIIAPCHRVIGASGALTGFAGGLKSKAFLLELEAKVY